MAKIRALEAAAVIRRGRLDPRKAGPTDAAAWSLPAISGRLVELSGRGASAVLTAAAGMVLEAQQAGEPVAWISARSQSVYPPDLAETGIDLGALVFVLTAQAAQHRAKSHRLALRAADRLLRSGAFGLVVLDLGERASVSLSVQTRLSGLAQTHGSALIVLTESSAEHASLGSLVSLRVQARRTREERGRFRCELLAIKDKRRGAGWRREEICRGPSGLR